MAWHYGDAARALRALQAERRKVEELQEEAVSSCLGEWLAGVPVLSLPRKGGAVPGATRTGVTNW